MQKSDTAVIHDYLKFVDDLQLTMADLELPDTPVSQLEAAPEKVRGLPPVCARGIL